MRTLLRVITLRHLSREPLRFLLTLFGIALGVAVLTAIRITNGTVLESFRSTVEALSGGADLEIRAAEQGMDETIYEGLHGVSGIRHAAPVVEVRAGIPALPGETILILGVDLLSDAGVRPFSLVGRDYRRAALQLLTEPTAILIGKEIADRLGLSEGSVFEVLLDDRVVHLTVRGLIEPDGPGSALSGRLAVMDIAGAQWTFDRLGKLDHIDLRLAPGVSVEDAVARLNPLVPGDAVVQPPERRNAQARRMLSAFQLNLTALSGISLFVGAFLIYNTVGISVVRRRREIGILRSMGASRGHILILFQTDALILGLLGSLLGVGIGIALAKILIGTVTQAVTANYLLIAVSKIVIDTNILIEGCCLGIGVSLIGSLVPVLEASRISPMEALQFQSVEVRRKMNIQKTSYAAGACLALSGVCAVLPPIGDFPFFGFLSAFFLLSGFSLVTPAVVLASGTLFPRFPWVRTYPERRIPAETIAGTPGRSSVTVSAIMIGMALLVSIGIMVGSFRKTVTLWVDQTMTADLLVVSPAGLFHGAAATFRESLENTVKRVPGVAAVNAVRLTMVTVAGEPIVLGAGNLQVHRRHGRFLPLRGDSSAMIDRAIASGGVIISEGLSRRRHLVDGDELILETPRGPRSFPITGVVYDYSSDRGKIFMDRSLYTRLWGDTRLTVLDVYRDRDTPLSQLKVSLEQIFSGRSKLDVIRHEDLREGVLEVFDQTFAVTSALQGIAVIVAVLGIATTLLAAILERRREIGTLRAVGASRIQVGKLFLFEAGYLGILGIVLGTAAGLVLSVILIYVINRQSFHWTIQYVLDVETLLYASVVMMVASLLAGLYPARRAAQLPVADALHYE